MSAYHHLSEDQPLPDLSGIGLRTLADTVRLSADDRSALAESLRRLRAMDESAPPVLTHAEQP